MRALSGSGPVAARAQPLAATGRPFAAWRLREVSRPRRRVLKGEFSVARFRECLQGTPVGALRASLGLATSEGDLDRLVSLLKALLE
jgi:hypothetical protein